MKTPSTPMRSTATSQIFRPMFTTIAPIRITLNCFAFRSMRSDASATVLAASRKTIAPAMRIKWKSDSSSCSPGRELTPPGSRIIASEMTVAMPSVATTAFQKTGRTPSFSPAVEEYLKNAASIPPPAITMIKAITTNTLA